MISLAGGPLAGVLLTSVSLVRCSIAGGLLTSVSLAGGPLAGVLLTSVSMVIAPLAGGLVRFTDDFVRKEASDENKGQLNAVVNTNRDTYKGYWKLF